MKAKRKSDIRSGDYYTKEQINWRELGVTEMIQAWIDKRKSLGHNGTKHFFCTLKE